MYKLEFQFWNDAPKGVHSSTINKNNKISRSESTKPDISRDYKINTIKSIISNNKEKIIEKKLYTISKNGQLNLKK